MAKALLLDDYKLLGAEIGDFPAFPQTFSLDSTHTSVTRALTSIIMPLHDANTVTLNFDLDYTSSGWSTETGTVNSLIFAVSAVSSYTPSTPRTIYSKTISTPTNGNMSFTIVDKPIFYTMDDINTVTYIVTVTVSETAPGTTSTVSIGHTANTAETFLAEEIKLNQ